MEKKNKIKIHVIGYAASGKTLISQIIKKQLKKLGLEVTYSNPDDPYNIEIERTEETELEILDAIKDKVVVEIQEIQTNRVPYGN